MGGAHVAAVAATRPDLVGGLVLEDPHWPSQPEDPAGYGSPNGGPTSPPDKVKPLDELLEVGRRNNPDGWRRTWSRGPEPTKPSTPAVPNWLYSSYDIDRCRDTMARVSCSTLCHR
jgi:pimeloyl-ACP methyl ester carboxylesterase